MVLLAFAIRAVSLEAQSLWRDEVDALCYAFGFSQALAEAVEPGSTANALEPPCACPPTPIPLIGHTDTPLPTRLSQTLREMVRNNGPLYYLLLRIWLASAGTSVTALRFFSLWFGVLGVPLTYALGRRLLDRTTGLVAALLTATSPYLVWYGQEAKMYTLLPTLALLAIYALRRAVEGQGVRWWITQIAATSLALYTHIWSALLIPIQAVLFLTWWPRSRRRWLGGLVSLVLLTLPYLPLATWEVRRVFVRQETGFPSHSLGEMASILLKSWSTGLSGWNWKWGAAASGGAALLGLASALLGRRQARSQRTAIGLVGWMALPVIGIWFVSLWQPLFTDRYLIWAAPAFYLLAGAGLAFLWQHGRWPALPLLTAVLLLFAGNLWSQATTPLKSDLRAAAAYVEERYEEGDLLIFQIPRVHSTFDCYFLPSDYAWADGLYTNHLLPDGSYRMSAEESAAWMRVITRGYPRVWLVASETEMWDRRHLVEGWLEANNAQVEKVGFAWVEVHLYEMDRPP
jgi:hypothetical protein